MHSSHLLSLIILAATSGLLGCSSPDDAATIENVVGSDRDEHGCIGSAGYQWCAKLAECVRPWELELGDTAEQVSPEAFATYCADSK